MSMTKSTSPRMTAVQKSNDKVQKKKFHKNIMGNIEGKTLQEPLNDKPEYKDVDTATLRIPAPEDGSIPTWRCKNGVVLPMIKVEKEDGSIEYKPRKTKGPQKGKKYGPRAGKITQMLQQGGVFAAGLSLSSTSYDAQIAQMNQVTAAHMPTLPAAVSTDVFGDLSKVMNEADCVDFQALVHSWQMRSIGALTDAEFALIKRSIFEKRQTAQAAMVTPQPVEAEEAGPCQRTESTADLTF